MTSHQTQTWIALKAERAHREHSYHCFEAERRSAQCTQSERGGQKKKKTLVPLGTQQPILARSKRHHVLKGMEPSIIKFPSPRVSFKWQT